MPRHDPPESGGRRSSSGRGSYSDPPTVRSNMNSPPDVVLIPEPSKASHEMGGSHSSDTESTSPPPAPPSQQRKDRQSFGTLDNRMDLESPRKSGSLSSRESAFEELPDSLMEAYTLSSHSNTRNRRSSQARNKKSSTPTTTPLKSASSGGSRVVIENLPPTPLTEVPIDAESNRLGRTVKTPGSGTNQSGTYLTRKAHKFSSIKKKRGATNMLHRLFCNSPSKDEDGVERSTLDNVDPDDTVALADSDDREEDQKMTSPRKVNTQEKENLGKEDDLDSGCLSLSEMMDRAKDTFMLSAEADVRKSIQSAVSDALHAVQNATTPKKKETKSVKIDPQQDKADEESLASIFDHWKRKSMGATADESNNSETTPAWKAKAQAAARKNAMSVEKNKAIQSSPATPVATPGSKAAFPSTIKYWEAVTTGKKAPGNPPMYDDQENKAPATKDDKEAEDVRDAPPRQSSPMEGDKLENAFLALSHSGSIVSAPSDEPNLGKRSAKKEVPVETISLSQDDDAAFLPDDFAAAAAVVPPVVSQEVIDQAIAKARKEWEEQEVISMRRQWEEQKVNSVRMQLEADFAKERDVKLAEIQAAEHAKWEAIEAERKKTLAAVEAERQKKLDEIEQEMAKLLEIQKEHLERHTPKKETERKLRDLRLQLQAEKDIEIKQLKKKYERQLSDQKEQLADAKRKMESNESLVEQLYQKSGKLEEEISQLRLELENSNSNQSTFNLEEHQAAVSTLEEQHKTVITELEQKHAMEMDKLRAQNECKIYDETKKATAQLEDRNNELEIENATLKSDKEELEASKKALEDETAALKNERTELWEKIAAIQIDHTNVVNQLKAEHKQALEISEEQKNKLSEPLAAKIAELEKEYEAKIQKAQQEVEADKYQLSLREQTLQAREELVTVQEKIVADSKEKTAPNETKTPPKCRGTLSPTRSPTRSNSKIQKPGVKTPLRKSEALEVLEREKEGLQKQIKVLEAQALEASQEHERTLREFRAASEDEIVRLKKELERRQTEHSEREGELRESLNNVDSWEKEELLEKIEQLEWDKKNDRTGGLREVQKKEELLQKISRLEKNEKKLLDDHEVAMRELREANENEVQRLKDEIEKQHELQSLRELSSSLSETTSDDKDDLLKKIESLETDLETEKNAGTLVKLKLQAMEKEKCEYEASHLEELSRVRDHTEDKISELTSQVEELKAKVKDLVKKEEELAKSNEKINELENELKDKVKLLEQIEEKLQGTKHEKDAVTDRLSELESKLCDTENNSELESLRKKHKEEIETFRAEASKNLYESKKEAEEKVKKLQLDHDSIVESLKSYHKEHVEKMVAEAKDQAGSLTVEEECALREKISELEKEKEDNLRHIKEVEHKLREQARETEERVRQVSERHTRELDDLIGQLDLLESEQKEKFEKKDNEIKEKTKQIEILETQLSDAQTRVSFADDSTRKIEQLAAEAEKAQAQVEQLTEELDSLRTAHEKYIEEAEDLKEAACEEARDEMIERAEIQFKQANELYVKLKRQYDNSKSKAERLDNELNECRLKMENLSAEKHEAEVSIRAELAQAHAENAKIEADAAQRAKDYRKEMEGLLQAAKEFEQKADAAEALSRNVQKTLAALVVEKDKLERAHQALKDEHEEMKQVCEELMAELEGRQNEY